MGDGEGHGFSCSGYHAFSQSEHLATLGAQRSRFEFLCGAWLLSIHNVILCGCRLAKSCLLYFNHERCVGFSKIILIRVCFSSALTSDINSILSIPEKAFSAAQMVCKPDCSGA